MAQKYNAALKRLGTRPFSCGLAYENRLFAEEIRRFLFWIYRKRKYRALFAVREDEVVILAVRAPGEKPVNPDDTTG